MKRDLSALNRSEILLSEHFGEVSPSPPRPMVRISVNGHEMPPRRENEVNKWISTCSKWGLKILITVSMILLMVSSASGQTLIDHLVKWNVPSDTVQDTPKRLARYIVTVDGWMKLGVDTPLNEVTLSLDPTVSHRIEVRRIIWTTTDQISWSFSIDSVPLLIETVP